MLSISAPPLTQHIDQGQIAHQTSFGDITGMFILSDCSSYESSIPVWTGVYGGGRGGGGSRKGHILSDSIWRRFEVRGRGRFELGFVAFQMQTWESADNASMMQWQKQRYEAYRRYGGQISEGSPTVAITVL